MAHNKKKYQSHRHGSRNGSNRISQVIINMFYNVFKKVEETTNMMRRELGASSGYDKERVDLRNT